MKKVLRNMLLFGALMSGSLQAQADIVGNTDCSTGYLGAFSDPFILEPNQTLYVEFVNHSSRVNNWENWLLEVANGEHGTNGFQQYFVLRADNAAMSPQGVSWESTTWFTSMDSNFNWGTFLTDMDGSTVKMTVERVGKTVNVNADITTTTGTKYYEKFIMDCGDGTQDIVAYLSVEKAYLDIDYNSVQITDNGMPSQEVEGQLIGATDNSSPFWTAFSDYFYIAPDQTLTVKFNNYSDCQEIYHNWLLAVCNNAPRGGEGYKEYFVMRADNWGWGDNWNAENLSNDWEGWETFLQDMNGAEVQLTIRREDARVYVDVLITTPNGDLYFKNYFTECGDGKQVLRAFFTVEKSHIIITESDTFGDLPGGLVGNIDYSSAWWTAFSDYYTLQPNETLAMTFQNCSSQVNNWNNYNLCLCTDADRGATDYNEYFVVRSDVYGWGDLYANGTFTHNFPTTTDDQGNIIIDGRVFRSFMNGATVTMNIVRQKAKVTVAFDIQGTDGNVYNETFTLPECGDGTQNVRAFLIPDNSYLIIDESSVSITPSELDMETAIHEVQNETDAATVYTLQGIRVKKAQHGVFIKNGKKYVR